jgi:multidrug efflux system membrane fusion protein
MRRVLLTGLVGLLAGCGSHPAAEAPAGRDRSAPVPVRAAVAARADVPVQITAIGTVEAFSTVDVRSQVEGELAHVAFQEGQEVKQGELLFMIDPRPFQARLQEAEANLARNRAEAANAAANAKRVSTLFREGVTSRDELDRAQAAATANAASVAADQAAVDRARLDVQYCYLRAPMEGRIGQLLVHQGSIVKADDTVLAVINRIRPVRVAFSVPQRDLPAIRRYMADAALPVVAYLGDQKTPAATGHLEFVNNAVDTTTGTVLLKALFANEDEALWPGQFVRVTLTLTTLRGVVTVPASAVQTGQAGPYVFVIGDDDTVDSRPVRTGLTVDGTEVIEDGLQAGARVVTDGQIRLAPGLRVTVQDDTAKTAEAPR